jgi:hypothetical protein
MEVDEKEGSEEKKYRRKAGPADRDSIARGVNIQRKLKVRMRSGDLNPEFWGDSLPTPSTLV